MSKELDELLKLVEKANEAAWAFQRHPGGDDDDSKLEHFDLEMELYIALGHIARQVTQRETLEAYKAKVEELTTKGIALVQEMEGSEH